MMTACESLLPFQLMPPPAHCSSRFRAPFETGCSICTLRQAHLCQSCCCCCCRCLLIWEANDDSWAVPHLKLMTTLRAEEGPCPPTSRPGCRVLLLFRTNCKLPVFLSYLVHHIVIGWQVTILVKEVSYPQHQAPVQVL